MLNLFTRLIYWYRILFLGYFQNVTLIGSMIWNLMCHSHLRNFAVNSSLFNLYLTYFLCVLFFKILAWFHLMCSFFSLWNSYGKYCVIFYIAKIHNVYGHSHIWVIRYCCVEHFFIFICILFCSCYFLYIYNIVEFWQHQYCAFLNGFLGIVLAFCLITVNMTKAFKEIFLVYCKYC